MLIVILIVACSFVFVRFICSFPERSLERDIRRYERLSFSDDMSRCKYLWCDFLHLSEGEFNEMMDGVKYTNGSGKEVVFSGE